MSYAMSGSRATGYLGFTGLGDDKVAEDAEVTLRFRGVGVSSGNARPVFDAIKEKVLATRHFKDPDYLGWGPSGTLAYRGEVKSDNFTLQEIANFMPNVARQISQATGKDVRFVLALDASGNTRTATQPDQVPGGPGPGPGPVSEDRSSNTGSGAGNSSSPLVWVAVAAAVLAVGMLAAREP